LAPPAGLLLIALLGSATPAAHPPAVRAASHTQTAAEFEGRASHGRAASALVAAAIPPFSRRYRTSCSTCHVTPGKLNTQGEAFRMNGYRFPDDDARLRHDQPVPLGAEPWKDLWPQAIWPGEIPGALPLSIHLLNDVRVGRTAAGHTAAGFVFPAGLEIQSATALGGGLAAFAEVTWRPGSGLQTGEIRALLLDPLPFLPPRALALAIGALQPHLFTFGDMRLDRAARQLFLWQRLRLADWPVHRPGSDTLTAESGFRLAAVRPTIELGGLARGRFSYGLGLVQPPSATGDDGSPTDAYVKLRLKLGGLALDGTSATEGDAAGWGGQLLDHGVILEHFTYLGETRLSGGASDTHRSHGIATRVLAGRADVGAGGVWGRNANPWAVDGLGARHTSLYGRGEYLLFPWLVASLKIDRTRFHAVGAAGGDGVEPLHRARVMPGLVALLRQNVRAIAEADLYMRDEPRSGPAGEPPHALWLRLDVAF
jgi:hypothetical protein